MEETQTMTRHGIIARTKAPDKGDSVREALEHGIKKALCCLDLQAQHPP